MRLLIVTAISTLLLISGAFAQSNSPSDTPSERAKSETQVLEKARSEAQRGSLLSILLIAFGVGVVKPSRLSIQAGIVRISPTDLARP